MRTAFIETLCELAKTDERIWLLTGDLGFSVLECFAEKFPDRYVNMGVAEQNMTGVAAGLALSGKIVFTYSIANFPTIRCLEQIRNDVCAHNLDVKIVSVGGGFAYGSQGYTHHGVEDLAVMCAMPNMTVVAPGDPVEARLATSAITKHQGPCYLRLGKAGETRVHAEEPAFEIGKAIWLREAHGRQTVGDGTDATIFTTGAMLPTAMRVAENLQSENVSAAVASMHTLRPLDESAVRRALGESSLIVTLEEHNAPGPLACGVACVLAKSLTRPDPRLRYRGPPLFLGASPSHACGSREYLHSINGLSADKITASILRSLKCPAPFSL